MIAYSSAASKSVCICFHLHVLSIACFHLHVLPFARCTTPTSWSSVVGCALVGWMAFWGLGLRVIRVYSIGL